MTGQEIITKARFLLDDTVGGNYGWSTTELVDYLNDALNEICEKGFLIKDRDTPSICNIPVLANTAEYPLSNKIISIDKVRLSALKKTLHPTTEQTLDNYIGDGWPDNSGNPSHYIPDLERRKIILYPKPVADDTAILTVYRYPSTVFTEANLDTVSPEIDEQWHYRLAYGILYHAFMKNDVDLQNFPNLTNAFTMWGKTIEEAKRYRLNKRAMPRIIGISRGLL